MIMATIENVILNTEYFIQDFYVDTKGMEYLNYNIVEVIQQIFNSLQLWGGIEAAIDKDFYDYVNAIERPNNDGYLIGNAYRRLARNIYNELRTMEVWDSQGLLQVTYKGMIGGDIVIKFNYPITLKGGLRLPEPKPPKFSLDDWQAPLYWDNKNESDI